MWQNTKWLKYGVFIPFTKFYTLNPLKSLYGLSDELGKHIRKTQTGKNAFGVLLPG